jgi:acyl carrier protein
MDGLPHVSQSFNPEKKMAKRSSAEIQAEVKEFILREFLPGEAKGALKETTALVSGGILDSIATVKLVGFLEDQYGIRVEDHEMTKDHLDHLPDIAALVLTKQSG